MKRETSEVVSQVLGIEAFQAATAFKVSLSSLATLLDHRSNAGIGLNLMGVGKAFLLCAESGNQARDQRVASSGPGLKNDKVGMRSSEFLDPFFTALAVLFHTLDQSHGRLDQQCAGPDDGLVPRGRYGPANGFDPCSFLLAVVFTVELPEVRVAAFCTNSRVGQRNKKSHVTGELGW